MADRDWCFLQVAPAVVQQLKRRQTYLLYLTPQRHASVLYCERPLLASDSLTQHQLQVLNQLQTQQSGWIEEESPYGQLWARGRLEKGLPVGPWHYYAYSGELKLQGQHRADSSVWEEYHHTTDATYKIIQRIAQGLHQNYQLLGWDTLRAGPHRYQLRYLVGQDTMKEPLIYREQQVAQRTQYQGLWRHGWEERYNMEGTCIRRYHFEHGRLHGSFWERQRHPQIHTGYVEIDGYYQNDQKQQERHRYYLPDGTLERERWRVQDGKVQ